MKSVLNFKSKSEVVEEDKKNKMFFHDIINHTHGVLLFLSYKLSKESVVTKSDLELIQNEVKLMQVLIQNHFKYDHKNLENKEEYLGFDQFEKSIHLLFKIYFDVDVKISLELRGKIAIYESDKSRSESLIHFPTLYRILTNLIKNMSEASAKEVYFLFDYQDNELKIETRNDFGVKISPDQMADYLAQNILKQNKKSEGIGLDSISDLAVMSGGKFSFDVESGQWINHITVPHSHLQFSKKAA